MKKSLTLLIHLFYWIPSVIQVYVYLQVMDKTSSLYPQFAIAATVTELISFYLFYFFLFPILSKRKFVPFILYGLLSICAAAAIGFLSNKIMGIMSNLNDVRPLNPEWVYISSLLIKPLYSGLFACFIKGCLVWYSEIRYKKELEKKNLETELALLKAQLNPHFLFNTLNNIDILIEKDPELASIYLKQLSDMIRFMLYKSPSETISFDLEIKYIEQYITLQRIRSLTADFISFKTSGATTHLQIAPMLFIPFIENAFKHSTNKKNSNAIDINILVRDNVINFSCSNAFVKSNVLTEQDSGLGLGLIRRRLELLYKGKYELEVSQNNDRFKVTLCLNLNEN